MYKVFYDFLYFKNFLQIYLFVLCSFLISFKFFLEMLIFGFGSLSIFIRFLFMVFYISIFFKLVLDCLMIYLSFLYIEQKNIYFYNIVIKAFYIMQYNIIKLFADFWKKFHTSDWYRFENINSSF